MNIVSAIIGLIVVAAFILPFMLSGKSRKKNEKRLLASLQSLADKQNAPIGEHDFGTNFAIGVSKDGQHLFFTKGEEGKEVGKHLPLEQIQRCKSNTATHMVEVGKSKESVIDRLELVYQFKDNKQPDHIWILYNAADNTQLNDEIEVMRRWEKRLAIVLRDNKAQVKVAV
ncbi:hypothetical protein BH09BAC1_BH09BAC1_29960 [soil metagenome]